MHDGAVAQLAPHDVAKAVAYPPRTAVLERLYDREASPIEGERDGRTAPQRRLSRPELHKLGALTLVRQRQVRGALQHDYTATVKISLSQEPH
jgi:hypothetical protein